LKQTETRGGNEKSRSIEKRGGEGKRTPLNDKKKYAESTEENKII
jgi:hypothetical protein